MASRIQPSQEEEFPYRQYSWVPSEYAGPSPTRGSRPAGQVLALLPALARANNGAVGADGLPVLPLTGGSSAAPTRFMAVPTLVLDENGVIRTALPVPEVESRGERGFGAGVAVSGVGTDEEEGSLAGTSLHGVVTDDEGSSRAATPLSGFITRAGTPLPGSITRGEVGSRAGTPLPGFVTHEGGSCAATPLAGLITHDEVGSDVATSLPWSITHEEASSRAVTPSSATDPPLFPAEFFEIELPTHDTLMQSSDVGVESFVHNSSIYSTESELEPVAHDTAHSAGAQEAEDVATTATNCSATVSTFAADEKAFVRTAGPMVDASDLFVQDAEGLAIATTSRPAPVSTLAIDEMDMVRTAAPMVDASDLFVQEAEDLATAVMSRPTPVSTLGLDEMDVVRTAAPIVDSSDLFVQEDEDDARETTPGPAPVPTFATDQRKYLVRTSEPVFNVSTHSVQQAKSLAAASMNRSAIVTTFAIDEDGLVSTVAPMSNVSDLYLQPGYHVLPAAVYIGYAGVGQAAATNATTPWMAANTAEQQPFNDGARNHHEAIIIDDDDDEDDTTIIAEDEEMVTVNTSTVTDNAAADFARAFPEVIIIEDEDENDNAATPDEDEEMGSAEVHAFIHGSVSTDRPGSALDHSFRLCHTCKNWRMASTFPTKKKGLGQRAMCSVCVKKKGRTHARRLERARKAYKEKTEARKKGTKDPAAAAPTAALHTTSTGKSTLTAPVAIMSDRDIPMGGVEEQPAQSEFGIWQRDELAKKQK